MTLRGCLLGMAAALALAVPAIAQDAPGAQHAPGAHKEGRRILVMLRLPPAHDRANTRYGGKYGDAAAQSARRRTVDGIARSNGLELVESWPMPLIGVDCFVLAIPDSRPVDDVIRQVSGEKPVVWAQPMHSFAMQAKATPNDPLFLVQPTAGEWKLGELHRIAKGKGVSVAVIDSKVDVDHPDLKGQFIADRDFVGSRAASAEVHGTGIAGVIAAKSDNGMGIAGVAPRARLMALRACTEGARVDGTPQANCDSLSLAKALHYAIDRDADVINLSLSGPQDRLLASLIELGLRRRISVVAAFDPALPKGGFPASQPGVLPIAEESLPSVPEAVFRAPGNDVPTTRPGGSWGLASGNSYAAAQVSGLLALARERHGRDGTLPTIARSANGTIDACSTIVPDGRGCD